MQNIIVKKQVEIPGSPLFKEGQKVRVKDELADILVDRGFAKYDQGEEAKTEKAKKVRSEEKGSKEKK